MAADKQLSLHSHDLLSKRRSTVSVKPTCAAIDYEEPFGLLQRIPSRI